MLKRDGIYIAVAIVSCCGIMIFHSLVGQYLAPFPTMMLYYIGIGICIGMAMEWASIRRR